MPWLGFDCPRCTEVGKPSNLAGLMSYAVSVPDVFRRAAVIVDKSLHGVKPAELPMEQPTSLQLVINLKTAKALGLTMPPSVLLRADQVIDP